MNGNIWKPFNIGRDKDQCQRQKVTPRKALWILDKRNRGCVINDISRINSRETTGALPVTPPRSPRVEGEHTDIHCSLTHVIVGIRTHASDGKSINSQWLNFSCTLLCASYWIYHTYLHCGAMELLRRVWEPSSLTLKRLKWPSPLVNGHKGTYAHCINTTQPQQQLGDTLPTITTCSFFSQHC